MPQLKDMGLSIHFPGKHVLAIQDEIFFKRREKALAAWLDQLLARPWARAATVVLRSSESSHIVNQDKAINKTRDTRENCHDTADKEE